MNYKNEICNNKFLFTMITNTNGIKSVLEGVNSFVPNVGLTYTKPLEMNKYLDFRTNGKANPNPYYGGLLEVTCKVSNLQSGFIYDEQLERKYKKAGIVPVEKERTKELWWELVSLGLAKHKQQDEFYFRYQDHESSYIDVTYTFNGEPIEYNLVRPYVKESKTDYSKYQNGLDNPTQAKLLNIKYIKRMAINKEVYEVI